jgi:hypothetical protein
METTQQIQREKLVDSGLFSYHDAHRMIPDGEPASADEAAQAYESNPKFVPRTAEMQAGQDEINARGKALGETALQQMREQRGDQ